MLLARSVLVTLLALSVLAPLASAESDTTYALGESFNAAPLGTHKLDRTGAGDGNVQPLPACWADPVALSAPASFTDHKMEVALNLTSSSDGTITFELRAFQPDGSSRSLGTGAPPLVMEIQNAGRSTVPGTVPALPTTGVDRVDIGRAQGSESVSGQWAAGEHRGFCISASNTNSVYTVGSIINSEGGSQATIPLPELSGGLLFAMGTALVAGVVVVRRLK